MKRSLVLGLLVITTCTPLVGCAKKIPPALAAASIPPLVIPANIHNFRGQDYYPIPMQPPIYPPAVTMVPPGSSLWLDPRARAKAIATY